MSPGSGLPPLRVEQALQLLPDVDALGPLRAYLISTSRARPTAEPHRTVGKRFVQPDDLREMVPQALARIADHLKALYESAVEALEAEQRGDLSGAVRALLRAGEREQRVGRDRQARAWYDHALRVAEELRERRPEIETLRLIGLLEASRGQLEGAMRFFQRSLSLAEAELDHFGAALACQGLGEVMLAQGKWGGAESFFTKGLRFVAKDPVRSAHLHLGLGEVSRRRGQLEAAEDRLRRAAKLFAERDDAEGAALTSNAWGLLEADRGHHADALAHYREATAQLQASDAAGRLLMNVRLNLCNLYLDWDRLPDAEDEARRAEEAAIMHSFTTHLARLYVVMGKVRGKQADETGFVFFEKAIELAQNPESMPRLEAEIYRDYGLFRLELGDMEEAQVCLQRAREILEATGDGPLLAEIDAELARMPHAENNH